MTDTRTPRSTSPQVAWGAGFALALWLGLVAVLVLWGGLSDLPAIAIAAVVVILVLPVFLGWAGLVLQRALRAQDLRIARVQDSVDGMRTLWLEQAARVDVPDPRLETIAQVQRASDNARAVFATSRRPDLTPAPDLAAQPLLALGPEPRMGTSGPPAHDDLIRALHFPEDADDRAGFQALHRALAWHGTGQLVRSAQEVLTALAEEGIFMDDLRPDRARPEVWRAFAEGARGPAMAGLAGVRDRSCLALTVGRMRQDPDFREAAHRFLRAFDACLSSVAPELDDAALARLTETRSARAFMLLGRVTGVFGR